MFDFEKAINWDVVEKNADIIARILGIDEDDAADEQQENEED